MASHTDNVHAVNDLLLGMPWADRVSALVCAILTDEPRAPHAVADMIGLIGVMARCLSPAQRLAIVWCLLEEAERINAKWN